VQPWKVVRKLVAILRFIRRSTLLVGVGLVGGTVTAAGVVMLVTPGPGLVVIIAGLAILATQFAWAERALDRMKQKAIAARDKASARRADRRAEAAAGAASATPTGPTSVPDPQPEIGPGTSTDVPDGRSDIGVDRDRGFDHARTVNDSQQATG
jgi:uncharacterized protein (TIGR02611 family)